MQRVSFVSYYTHNSPSIEIPLEINEERKILSLVRQHFNVHPDVELRLHRQDNRNDLVVLFRVAREFSVLGGEWEFLSSRIYTHDEGDYPAVVVDITRTRRKSGTVRSGYSSVERVTERKVLKVIAATETELTAKMFLEPEMWNWGWGSNVDCWFVKLLASGKILRKRGKGNTVSVESMISGRVTLFEDCMGASWRPASLPEECIVCMDAAPSVCLGCCGCWSLCRECATTLLKRDAACPQCRQPVLSIRDIQQNHLSFATPPPSHSGEMENKQEQKEVQDRKRKRVIEID